MHDLRERRRVMIVGLVCSEKAPNLIVLSETEGTEYQPTQGGGVPKLMRYSFAENSSSSSFTQPVMLHSCFHTDSRKLGFNHDALRLTQGIQICGTSRTRELWEVHIE